MRCQHRYADSYKAKSCLNTDTLTTTKLSCVEECCCVNTDTLTATKLSGRVLLFQHKYADSHKTTLCGRVVGGEHNCASVKPMRSSSTNITWKPSFQLRLLERNRFGWGWEGEVVRETSGGGRIGVGGEG